MSNDNVQTDASQKPAVGAPVERGVRPHAIRLASQLQSAAYSHGYEDGHPSNATTRQDKYSAASQRLLSELREAIELLIAERDNARADLAVEKRWGELWYFVSDEEPLKFEKIVSEWTPSRWIDQAYKLMAAKRC